jgi:hypothetical protein
MQGFFVIYFVWLTAATAFDGTLNPILANWLGFIVLILISTYGLIWHHINPRPKDMSKIDDLRCKLAQLEDDIACAEHDEEMDGDTTFDLDDAYCRATDLRCEIEELE